MLWRAWKRLDPFIQSFFDALTALGFIESKGVLCYHSDLLSLLDLFCKEMLGRGDIDRLNWTKL